MPLTSTKWGAFLFLAPQTHYSFARRRNTELKWWEPQIHWACLLILKSQSGSTSSVWDRLPSGDKGLCFPEAQPGLSPPSLPVPYVQIGLTLQSSLVLKSSHYQGVHSKLNFNTIWLSPLVHMQLTRNLARTEGTSNPNLPKNLIMKKLNAYTSSPE